MHAKVTALEKMTGKRGFNQLTMEEQAERFPMLKNAPVEGGWTKNVKVSRSKSRGLDTTPTHPPIHSLGAVRSAWRRLTRLPMPAVWGIPFTHPPTHSLNSLTIGAVQSAWRRLARLPMPAVWGMGPPIRRSRMPTQGLQPPRCRPSEERRPADLYEQRPGKSCPPTHPPTHPPTITLTMPLV